MEVVVVVFEVVVFETEGSKNDEDFEKMVLVVVVDMKKKKVKKVVVEVVVMIMVEKAVVTGEDQREFEVPFLVSDTIEAYKEFGDVVSFDTTYLTNKYNMPFALFVGVNHHGQSILLGCGLLSDERGETFVWLFNDWLKCMAGCPPRAVITDQAKAMQNTIRIGFPAARHRWCIWHVMSKVPEKFGMYSKREKIIFTLQELIYDTQTPAEFETRWQKMLQKYSLGTNKWLSDLYDEKERWIPCFLNDTFWAGMSSTQRSEGMNAFFDSFLLPKTSLKQFVEQFEQALMKKVEKELVADAESVKYIKTFTKNPFEEQLQQLYTNDKYMEFSNEIKESVSCNILSVDNSHEISEYVIREDIWVTD
ncbi:protein FAR-RED IMPAIRED RESPONSE 1-like [Papaver somniferum]|uniref:protein FAR-RED IMPAIRED RESPONSE 1-like n=1 Tax=Papaver somniferum TaxID=3469 RepID=UPI000E6F6A42|nr:protein FAR-RED IMPAIRED RESPONSE 1-like [Papaver somniferum]